MNGGHAARGHLRAIVSNLRDGYFGGPILKGSVDRGYNEIAGLTVRLRQHDDAVATDRGAPMELGERTA